MERPDVDDNSRVGGWVEKRGRSSFYRKELRPLFAALFAAPLFAARQCGEPRWPLVTHDSGSWTCELRIRERRSAATGLAPVERTLLRCIAGDYAHFFLGAPTRRCAEKN